jgi:hypothetical protein
MSKSFPQKTIFTHTRPDMDAIGYIWLMKKFAPGFENADVQFVSVADQEVTYAMANADSVGDVGGIYNAALWRFDHHQLPGEKATATCATRMCWEALLAKGIDVGYLEPLINVIHEGDLGRTPPVGLHGLFWGFAIRYKADAGRSLTDQQLMDAGQELIDMAATWLKRVSENDKELSEKVIWTSPDKFVWAIQYGSAGSTFAAYTRGARIVVFEGEPFDSQEGLSYPVGASRAPEWKSPHLGKLVEAASTANPDLRPELDMWYRHQAGFFAGRGTQKGPNTEPPKADLISLARAIDEVWSREK